MCLEVIILIFDDHTAIRVLGAATIPELSILARHNDNPVFRIGMFIPDPVSEFFPSRIQGQKYSRIRIRIKEFKYFNPKNCF
jgi:hypothetical protein